MVTVTFLVFEERKPRSHESSNVLFVGFDASEMPPPSYTDGYSSSPHLGSEEGDGFVNISSSDSLLNALRRQTRFHRLKRRTMTMTTTIKTTAPPPMYIAGTPFRGYCDQ